MFLKRISRWKYFNFKKTIRFYEIYFNDFDDLRNGIIFIYECLKKDKCIGSIFNLELKTEIDFKNSRYLFKHNNLDYYLIDDINYLNDIYFESIVCMDIMTVTDSNYICDFKKLFYNFSFYLIGCDHLSNCYLGVDLSQYSDDIISKLPILK